MNNDLPDDPTRVLSRERRNRKWLARFSIAAAVSAYVLIIFGSHVRVTESGMGCPDWPLCYGQPGPIYEFHALMEQGHRYLASLVSLLVIAAAIFAYRSRRIRPSALRPALFTVGMLAIQVILGGVTVFAGNGSPTVALHLVAGLTLLGGATVTAVCAVIPRRTAPGRRLKRVGWIAVAAVGVLLASGSLIVDAEVEGLCASVPFCPTGPGTSEVAVHLGHRTIVLLAMIAVVAFAVHVWRGWSRIRGARTLAITLVSLVVVNAGIGITSALLMAPPEWADLHLAGAAAVMITVLCLATLGWLVGADAPEGELDPEQDDRARSVEGSQILQFAQVDLRDGSPPAEGSEVLQPAGVDPRDGAPSQNCGFAAVRDGGVVVGMAIVVLAIAAGISMGPGDPGASTTTTASAGAVVASTGETTRVAVEMKGMRYFPDEIAVPTGNTLIIELTNNGEGKHDLVLETGQRATRLAPGESAELNLGPVGQDLEGWCSVAGHQWLGMTLRVVVTGGAAAGETGAATSSDHSTGHQDAALDGPSAAKDLDLSADPGEDFVARDAALEPASDQRVHRIRLKVSQSEQEVAPGVRQTRWTFGGSAPGPTLRGRVGDKFVVTLVNDGDVGHSIDFHAGALAPDRPMRTIQPGEKLRYTFTATRAGIWLYHCSTAPMSMHIANGMFGAVIIDPPDLAPVDREFLLVQSELYLGPQGGSADALAIRAEKPDLVVFNGYPKQYAHQPLAVEVGERIRVWVLAAGPSRGTAFHVVGGQFDTVYLEGDYRLRPGVGGSQVLGLATAQGGFVEFSLPQAGNYPFVSHSMVDAERGALGILHATQP